MSELERAERFSSTPLLTDEDAKPKVSSSSLILKKIERTTWIN